MSSDPGCVEAVCAGFECDDSLRMPGYIIIVYKLYTKVILNFYEVSQHSDDFLFA